MLYFKTIASSTLELLKGLQHIAALNNSRLVGGTALALQIGHRTSVDLDLFTVEPELDFLSIISDIKKKNYKIEIRKQSKNIMIAMIDNVKVDIVNYPYKWLDIKIVKEEIGMASLKDIAAMKLSAITNRGTKKDFIDLYFLLKIYSLEQMLTFYSEKYDNASAFMVLKSLTYFEDADLEAPPLMIDKTISWDIVKEGINREVKSII